MKEFSLKKSMLMLVALFMLGACSNAGDNTTGTTWVNEDGDVLFLGDNGTFVETDDEGSCKGTYKVTALSDYTVKNNAETVISDLNDYDKLYELTIGDEMMGMVMYYVVKIVDDKMYMIDAELSEDDDTVMVFADNLDDDNADVYTKKS